MAKSKEDKINAIKSRSKSIFEKYEVVKAGLFGSVTRGEDFDNSDIDFLIEFSSSADISLLEIAGLKIDLEETLNKKVDIVEYDAVRKELRDYILPTEVRIYEKR